ncbi:MAG: nucleotide sugar dehydrogenase [Thermoplasmata archaeon HGW-Thermoplasmata-1]|nr:MAG: nucleotide sugar dehydrogenase [Thermoplasmata archaeon HGW-Thermoplasmata-1]
MSIEIQTGRTGKPAKSEIPEPTEIPKIKKIVVVGMGYVGIPVAALFAKKGFDVVGLDVNPGKIESLNNGMYPIHGDEPGMAGLVAETVHGGKFSASPDFSHCRDANAILVAVETPFDTEKMEPDYSSLKSALSDIARNLSKGALVVIESTIAPTTMDLVVRPILEKISGMKAGADFLLGNCPERVMPGKLIHNLTKLDRVVGGIDDKTRERMIGLYSSVVEGRLHKTDMITAEIVKTAENAYRDVEIAFANELGIICEKLGANAFEVRELVNRSPYRNVHVPGAGVGGHCIPKDTLLLAYGTKGSYRPLTMLTARAANDSMPLHVAELALDAMKNANVREPAQEDAKVKSPVQNTDDKKTKVAILGLAYIPNSDDARNSPTETLYFELQKNGYDVTVHDPFVTEPHVGKLGPVPYTKDLEKALSGADCAVLMTAHDEYKKLTPANLKTTMRKPAMVDGRNFFDKAGFEKAGFVFRGVGK